MSTSPPYSMLFDASIYQSQQSLAKDSDTLTATSSSYDSRHCQHSQSHSSSSTSSYFKSPSSSSTNSIHTTTSTSTPYSPQSLTGTVRSNRTFGPSTSSSLGSPFSIADLQLSGSPGSKAKQHTYNQPSSLVSMAFASSGSFLDMHPSPHSPLITLSNTTTNNNTEDQRQSSQIDCVGADLTASAKEVLETVPLPVLLARSLARITEAEKSNHYYQQACVVSTMDNEFWQREYRQLYREHRSCESKLEEMTRRCKEMEYSINVLMSCQRSRNTDTRYRFGQAIEDQVQRYQSSPFIAATLRSNLSNSSAPQDGQRTPCREQQNQAKMPDSALAHSGSQLQIPYSRTDSLLDSHSTKRSEDFNVNYDKHPFSSFGQSSNTSTSAVAPPLTIHKNHESLATTITRTTSHYNSLHNDISKSQAPFHDCDVEEEIRRCSHPYATN